MKQAITRFGIYLFILAVFEVLTGGFETAPGQTLKAQLGFYVGYYVLGWGFLMAIAESIYRAFRWLRRRRESLLTKELPVPDTQQFGALANHPLRDEYLEIIDCGQEVPDTQPLSTYRSDVDEEWYRMHNELHKQADTPPLDRK